MIKLTHYIVLALNIVLVLNLLPITVHGQVPNEVRKTAYQYLVEHEYIQDSVLDGGYTFYVNKVVAKKCSDSIVTVYEFGGNLEHGKILLLVEYLKPNLQIRKNEVLGTENTLKGLLKVYDFLQKHDFTCADRDRILSLMLFDLKRSRID